MNLSNLQLKFTDKGLVLEAASKKKRKPSKMVTYQKNTKPLNYDKVNALERGGWSQEDIKRMMQLKPKSRMMSDGGYVYI